MNKYIEDEIRKLKFKRTCCRALCVGHAMVSTMAFLCAMEQAVNKHLFPMIFYGVASMYLLNRGCQRSVEAAQISQKIKDLQDKSR